MLGFPLYIEEDFAELYFFGKEEQLIQRLNNKILTRNTSH